jgi:hypothetical protein
VTQNPFSRFEDTLYDYFVLRKFGQVFRSMSGAHVHSLGTGIARQFDIVRVVSDDERSSEINMMVGRRKTEEMWIRFDALAFIRSLVRARVGFRDPHARLGQLPNHMCVDAFYIPAGEFPFGYP